MKRLLVPIFLVALCALPAVADTLPEQVRAEAARLLVQVNAAETAAKAKPGMKPAALPPALVGDLQRFGFAASRLSTEIDQRGGPTDLRCIFRGMAEETDAQLKSSAVAKTGADQARALARLSHMLKDAVEIAPAVGGASAQVNDRAMARCPAAAF